MLKNSPNSRISIHLIILDGLGIGELPDASEYGDEGSNTLKSISQSREFSAPNLEKLGIFNIADNGISKGIAEPIGCFAKVNESSKGKDTITGHWEIAGLISSQPFPTYPNGFPEAIISEFERLTGRKVLCNQPYSGTEVIEDYGLMHMQTGDLIVYTSADSVFQIAAHEDVISVDLLYEYCKMARELLQGEHMVARIIARPFVGVPEAFTRTSRRKDFSVSPPRSTLLDLIKQEGYDMIGIGKISDIFAGRGLTESFHTDSNLAGMERAYLCLLKGLNGLIFTNLVDFDMLYGHRNDVDGYAHAISSFDEWLGRFISKMKENDILIITADHGCDPKTPSTDHSREYVPLLVYGGKIKKGVDLGILPTFADIGATIAEILGIKYDLAGNSFYQKIKR